MQVRIVIFQSILHNNQIETIPNDGLGEMSSEIYSIR